MNSTLEEELVGEGWCISCKEGTGENNGLFSESGESGDGSYAAEGEEELENILSVNTESGGGG